ncbi:MULTISPECIES: hypothetical protein [unclassified Mesorhizobium]|uniref:hypothetical protein n=1 Tax=unclassified Mesorhizobium TaxID=325217 RepID=UPI003334E59C
MAITKILLVRPRSRAGGGLEPPKWENRGLYNRSLAVSQCFWQARVKDGTAARPADREGSADDAMQSKASKRQSPPDQGRAGSEPATEIRLLRLWLLKLDPEPRLGVAEKQRPVFERDRARD